MVTCLAGPRDLRLADGHDEIVELRNRSRHAVKHFVLQEHDRVRIADGRLEQALGVGGGRGCDHLEPRHMRVPCRIFLAVLGGNARRRPVRPAEYDRARDLPAGHVMRLGRRIDDMVDGLHGEVEGHEFHDGAQPRECRANAEPREAHLGDGRVDHAARPELVEQPLGNLVRALVFRDLLAHDEHGIVAAHFLRHGIAKRLAHGGLHHLRTGRDFGGSVISRRLLPPSPRPLPRGEREPGVRMERKCHPPWHAPLSPRGREVGVRGLSQRTHS